MKEIVQYQYQLAELFLEYVNNLYIQHVGDLTTYELKLFEIDGIVFITVFFLSLVAFILGRIVGRIFKFRAYNAEKYRLLLFFNIFYFIPFVYGFIGGRFNVINIFLIFLGSGAYFAFDFIINNPDTVIHFFAQKGFYI